MKKVYTTSDNVLVGYLHGILQDRSINCLIKNEFLSGVAGEIPGHHTWPEIWVLEDNDEVLAKKIIEEILNPKKSQRDWQCHSCGEWIENQFSDCWQCTNHSHKEKKQG